MLWEREQDAHNDLIATEITRDKFDFVMKHLHFTDNNSLDLTDKFAKIRPVFQHLKEKLMQFGSYRKIIPLTKLWCHITVDMALNNS